MDEDGTTPITPVSTDGRLKLIDERKVRTAEEFVSALLPMAGNFVERFGEGLSWMFRGQADATWKLQASAFRDSVPTPAAPQEEDDLDVPPTDEDLRGEAAYQANKELESVVEFAVLADRHGYLLPGDAPTLRDPRRRSPRTNPLRFPPTDLLGMFALAQHHGIPMRLLDWTWKPLVAAYFAAVDAARKHTDRCRAGRAKESPPLAVWALSGRFVQLVCRDRDPGLMLLSAPSASNPNLHAQAGLFTFVQPRSVHAIPLPAIDEYIRDLELRATRGEPLYESPGKLWQQRFTPILVKLTLPAAQVRTLARLLVELGVSAASMYPGLDGVVKAIKERELYQWGDERS